MATHVWFSSFVAFNALLLLALAANVSRHRVRSRVSLGDGADQQLMIAIRAHSNGIEQVPIFACALLVLSLQASSTVTLAVFSIGF